MKTLLDFAKNEIRSLASQRFSNFLSGTLCFFGCLVVFLVATRVL